MNKRCPQFLQGTTVFYTLEKIETMVIQNWVARWGGRITKCIMDNVKMVNFLDPIS